MTDLRQRPQSSAPVPALQRLGRALASDRRVRYVVVGGIAAVVSYTIFSAGWLLLSRWIPYLLMAVIANVATAVLTYPLYRSVVFQSNGPWISGFLRFYVICFWSLAVGLFGLPLLVEVAHVGVLVSQAIVIGVVPLINYQVNKYWAFRARSADLEEAG